ncbi:1,2-dihydroxy-3-keto-5-methylthiopentene dioxygenase [Mycena sanguinolenta]|uniref:acireductone dioxygenase (Fe(2+)-requiring) n=1 Tax=Mycena sanguinolenta TaxID=230812 RepID=A0A8H6Y3F3_9AGAR|nr:1,2-dihydroxy-3-keto-5-methylthiopentene dioxygenase [Mycena sanguinolenta]
MHEDEEIRYISSGSGFFDVRETPTDAWIRIVIAPGDLLVFPAGIYRRFNLDAKDQIMALRLLEFLRFSSAFSMDFVRYDACRSSAMPPCVQDDTVRCWSGRTHVRRQRVVHLIVRSVQCCRFNCFSFLGSHPAFLPFLHSILFYLPSPHICVASLRNRSLLHSTFDAASPFPSLLPVHAPWFLVHPLSRPFDYRPCVDAAMADMN